ncbi:lytic transglycosylase domain-containing protein [Dictyobacter formicarum]|uniref:Transglycosylase SLT domain-containing protein n=1 Tax=Dictyobacter formicarum TaxID=2778368 RepID=A0ABQ3VSN0_9CHLR|nr:lytic transglycosylase domain-containing protein [Dictyobacter formicarum]GHO89292.1 hypothetical protein KSZ_72980 [Dictyobacter formicarum]
MINRFYSDPTISTSALDSQETRSTPTLKNTNALLTENNTKEMPELAGAGSIHTYENKYDRPAQPRQNSGKSARTPRRLSNLRKGIAVGAACGALLLSGFAATHYTQVGNIGSTANYQQHQVVSTTQHDHHRHQSSASVANSYIDMARSAASSAGISPDYFVRQINQESGFNPNVVSPVGALGIAQFMPGTAAEMGVNPSDPQSSLTGAARWMGRLSRQFGGDYAKALAAYNAGPGAVQGAVNAGGGNWLAYLPAETQNYVRSIMG